MGVGVDISSKGVVTATGADLAMYCPHCRKGLNHIDPQTGKVWTTLAVRHGDQRGDLDLSPRLNVFERQSAVELDDGTVVDDLACPHCRASLIDGRSRCGECSSPAASLIVAAETKLIDFSICTRIGCQWHGVTPAEERQFKPKIARQKKPEQDAVLRVRNFAEVSYGYDRELAATEAARCLGCKKPRCVAGCPVDVDIPAFVKLIRDGDPQAAARKIKEKNALPAICGRVCPQDTQCEKVCVLTIADQPVAIGALERFAADFERETDSVAIPHKAALTGHRVAIVGSGPAGLSLAADLVVLGHGVTVYEALHKAGGVLAYGIPEFRLPKAILEAEIGYLRRLGVKIELDTVIGNLYGLDDLFAMGYAAVYLATGAGLPMFMGLPGENLCNVVSANEYLTRVNLMKAYLFPQYDTPAPKGRHVAVIGGGNVAVDCARTALRMGSREVTIVYRRTRDEMPARAEEVVHAEQEGVRLRALCSPLRYIGDEQGWVRQAECVTMKLGDADASGRRAPIPVAGANTLMDVDLVIVAIGAGPNPTLFAGCPDLERDRRGYIATVDDAGRTSTPRVWAGGDIVTGSATVILAMGAARLAARDIHEWLSAGAVAWS